MVCIEKMVMEDGCAPQLEIRQVSTCEYEGEQYETCEKLEHNVKRNVVIF